MSDTASSVSNVRPLSVGDSFIKTKGFGYWDLTLYPWGGSFRRFTEDSTLIVERITDTYSDGSPRCVVALLGNKRVGVQF